jgi:hypothetical protein
LLLLPLLEWKEAGVLLPLPARLPSLTVLLCWDLLGSQLGWVELPNRPNKPLCGACCNKAPSKEPPAGSCGLLLLLLLLK